MVFDTVVASIPCRCLVYSYSPAIPMRITGSGFGDAEPPEDEEFSFRLLDTDGYPAPHLEQQLTDHDINRLKEEYLNDTPTNDPRYPVEVTKRLFFRHTRRNRRSR